MASGTWKNRHSWTAARIDRLVQAIGGSTRLAELMDVHITTVSRWRHGKSVPPSTKRQMLEVLERQYELA